MQVISMEEEVNFWPFCLALWPQAQLYFPLNTVINVPHSMIVNLKNDRKKTVTRGTHA